jgi:putative hydrolase of the HAD superfamily
MKYDAVIFDLFGTLVTPIIHSEYNSVLREVSDIVGANPTGFLRLWEDDTAHARAIGTYSTIRANIEHVCAMLDLSPTGESVDPAESLRIDYMRGAMKPWPDAVEALGKLQEQGLTLGLISDCSADVPPLFPETPLAPFFDSPVFSSDVGLKKPDPKIYALALERAAVSADRCLYVGDGGSRELTGAAAVGMRPILIRKPDEDTADVRRPESDDWSGEAISSLLTLLKLL